MLRDQRRVRRLGHGQRVAQPFGILEPEAAVAAGKHVCLRPEPLLPEVERVLGSHPPLDGMDHPGPRAAPPHARVLEERDVAPGGTVFVRVEEVVDGRVVLVDALLHEPEAEHACVEVHVPGRVRGDAGDVVNAVEAHRPERTAR